MVIAEATISSSGCVEFVEILKGVDPALDIMALNSVATCMLAS